MSEIGKMVDEIHQREESLRDTIAMRDTRWEKVWDHVTGKRKVGEPTLKQELNSMRLMYIMTYIKHGWDEELLVEMMDNLIG